MSVELYPDHKAILHFQDSLKVYEIDFLDELTEFLSQEEFSKRHFQIYVKPTISHSAFDFVVLEPNHALYVLQTPENVEQIVKGMDALDYFMEERLYTLSATLHRRIQQTVREKQTEKKELLIKPLYYIYDGNLYEEIDEKLDEELDLVTPNDFWNSTPALESFFQRNKQSEVRLSDSETKEIKETLNPNTNFKNYISTSLPKDYAVYAKSKTQSRQKFKGPKGSGKTLLLVKRVINCANRLKEDGRILVVSGNVSKVNELKNLITAEDGRSLQELGIDISNFQELAAPEEEYSALFIDDANYLKSKWIHYLLDNYLVEMTDENDYEYVVMANEKDLPEVPKIFGPFRTLNHDLGRINRMLSDSREIFLSIIEG